VLGVDVRGHPAGLLRVRHDVQAERRLAARLGAVDLGDAPLRHAADPDRASRLIAPVGIDATLTFWSGPIRMIDPLPQFFSICAMARFSAFFLSSPPHGRRHRSSTLC
jgi:hypothetical protein